MVIDMLLAQDANSEEKPLIIKIEENVIEKISSKDAHVSLFSFTNKGTGRINTNLLARNAVPEVVLGYLRKAQLFRKKI